MERLPEDELWVEGVSRRAALVTITGYALAAGPVLAAAIHTGAAGLTAGMVEVPGPVHAVRAYRARPATGRHPVILVVHEVFGLHEWVRDICRRLAHLGYYAIAPDLFGRLGDASKVADIRSLMHDIVQKTPDRQVFADLDHTLAFAGKDGGDAAQAGVVGFCWGGRMVWLYAAHNPRLKAGVAFYGPLAGKETPETPQNPIAVAPVLKVPVLGLYGAKDGGILPADIEAMRKALARGRSGSRITVFGDAGHGFLADYRASYVPDAATSSWQEMRRWFAGRLQGSRFPGKRPGIKGFRERK